MRLTGREALSREGFLDAIERMGLNLPTERQYEALYEGHCNLTGTVDVDAFCRAVVSTDETPGVPSGEDGEDAV